MLKVQGDGVAKLGTKVFQGKSCSLR
jgi:hypothetical protein